MMGMGYIRLNKILSKKRPPPRRTPGDVRLYRRIAWGAFVYFIVFALAHLVASRHDIELPNDVIYPFIIYIAPPLLICWWATDTNPRLARWLTVIVTLPSMILSVLYIFADEQATWNRVECLALAGYFALVGFEAIRQLVEIRNQNRLSGHETL